MAINVYESFIDGFLVGHINVGVKAISIKDAPVNVHGWSMMGESTQERECLCFQERIMKWLSQTLKPIFFKWSIFCV